MKMRRTVVLYVSSLLLLLLLMDGLTLAEALAVIRADQYAVSSRVLEPYGGELTDDSPESRASHNFKVEIIKTFHLNTKSINTRLVGWTASEESQQATDSWDKLQHFPITNLHTLKNLHARNLAARY